MMMHAHVWLLSLFRLTRRQYFADFFITPPLTIFLACYTWLQSTPWQWLLAVVVGWCAWTFYEYALHRWGLHELPVLRDIHALHHRNQTDYIAVPPWVTLISYAAFWLVFGLHSTAFMVGFSFGYIVYAAMHTACHYLDPQPGQFLFGVEQRHALHHRYSNVNFGISTSLWDRVFGTNSVAPLIPVVVTL